MLPAAIVIVVVVVVVVVVVAVVVVAYRLAGLRPRRPNNFVVFMLSSLYFKRFPMHSHKHAPWCFIRRSPSSPFSECA